MKPINHFSTLGNSTKESDLMFQSPVAKLTGQFNGFVIFVVMGFVFFGVLLFRMDLKMDENFAKMDAKMDANFAMIDRNFGDVRFQLSTLGLRLQHFESYDRDRIEVIRSATSATTICKENSVIHHVYLESAGSMLAGAITVTHHDCLQERVVETGSRGIICENMEKDLDITIFPVCPKPGVAFT